jgi:hypothetical protein
MIRKLGSGFCLFLLAAVTFYGQAKPGLDKWIGLWRMNLAKSKYESGTLPKTRILNFEPLDGGVKVSSDLLDDVGSVHIEFSVKYDGKDVPMRGAMPGSSIAATRVDGSTIETVQKADGKVTVTTRFVVSPDGKVITATGRGVDQKGVKFTNISVYDKQP